MKKIKLIIIIVVAACFLAIAVLVYFSMLKPDKTLEFKVIDKVSRGWVWDLTITLQNRVIKGYYQSAQGTTPFLFTHLAAGTYTMQLSAPAYTPVTVPVEIKQGKNKLQFPIELEGYAIPGFKRFYIFNTREGSDLVFELRPVNDTNYGIQNHPCMDLWIGCKIYTQVRQGVYVTSPTEYGSETGELLFKGKIPWEWDPEPATLYRYKARVQEGKIKKHAAPYRAVEFLILIPDPRKTSHQELDKLIMPLLDLENRKELILALDNYKDKFIYYLDENWNVPAVK